MLISKIVNLVNKRLAGELLSYTSLKSHLDSAIDEINQNLNACYPAFSELDVMSTEYNYFPDRFIRTVVVPGAAFYFYQVDEEGVNSAPGLEQEFKKNLFYMVRDFIHAVPAEYQDSEFNGTIPFNPTGAVDSTADGIFNMNFPSMRI